MSDDELSERARALIAFTRTRSALTPSDAARIEGPLFAKIAALPAPPVPPPGASGGGGTPGASAAGAGGATKIVVGLALVSVLAVVVVLAGRERSAPVSAVPAVSVEPAVTAPSPPASSASRAAAEDSPTADVVPTVDVAALPSVARASSAARAPSTTPSSSASAARPGIREEIALLQASGEALDRGDPARALTLLEEHAQRFPRGTLREDRLAAHIRALCAAKRDGEGRAELERFMQEYPRSPHVPSVTHACGEQK